MKRLQVKKPFIFIRQIDSFFDNQGLDKPTVNLTKVKLIPLQRLQVWAYSFRPNYNQA